MPSAVWLPVEKHTMTLFVTSYRHSRDTLISKAKTIVQFIGTGSQCFQLANCGS